MPYKLSDRDSGYQSTAADWVAFLSCWNEKLGERKRRNFFCSSDLRNSEIAIKNAESRLSIHLPRSYRDFLIASGGDFSYAEDIEDTGTKSTFIGCDDLNWFPVLLPSECEKWCSFGGWPVNDDDYYRYDLDEMQNTVMFKIEYLKNLLLIGKTDDGTLILLNPSEHTRDGEWEAWELSWHFWARRFRCFADLMQNQCYSDTVQPIFDKPYLSSQLNASCASLIVTSASKKKGVGKKGSESELSPHIPD